jgi:hypothetical protein
MFTTPLPRVHAERLMFSVANFSIKLTSRSREGCPSRPQRPRPSSRAPVSGEVDRLRLTQRRQARPSPAPQAQPWGKPSDPEKSSCIAQNTKCTTRRSGHIPIFLSLRTRSPKCGLDTEAKCTQESGPRLRGHRKAHSAPPRPRFSHAPSGGGASSTEQRLERG